MTETKKCLWCGCVFERTPENRNNWHLKKYCSLVCSNKYNYYTHRKADRARRMNAEHPTQKCLWCGDDFVRAHKYDRWCTSACRNSYKHFGCSKIESEKLHIKKCKTCGKSFSAPRKDTIFCSKSCSLWWHDHIGFHHTIKQARINKAKKYGLGVEEYIKFTSRCAICGWSHNIHVHHIVPKASGGANAISNYMPLCCNCHQLMHVYKDKSLVENEINEWKGTKGLPGLPQ